jgi:putative aldouronate transport system substrate-binding protein
MNKKLYAIALAAAVAAPLAACGEAAPAGEAGPPVELQIAIRKHGDDVLEGAYFEMVEKKLNLKLTFIPMPEETLEEKRNVLLASGEKYDLISTDAGVANLWGQEGVFAEADPLIQQYGTGDIQQLLDKGLTSHLRDRDFKLFMFPRNYHVNTKMDYTIAYRSDILKALGAQEPTTMDEWYTLFARVKERYPDVIPLTCNAFADYAKVFSSLWDMAYVTGNYGLIGSKMDQHTLEFMPLTQNYRDSVGYWQKLYAEGLLDKEWPTITNDQWTEKIANGRIFAYLTNEYRANWGEEIAKEAGNEFGWIGALWPVSVTGKRQHFKNPSPWIDFGMSIYEASAHKPEIMKFLNYMYTQECMLDFYYGVEGASYKVENGQRVSLFEEPAGPKRAQAVGMAWHLPRMDSFETSYGNLDSYPIRKHIIDGNEGVIVPVTVSLKFTEAEGEELSQLQSTIDAQVLVNFSEIVLGRKSLGTIRK